MLYQNNDNYIFESKTKYGNMGSGVDLEEGRHMPFYWFKYKNNTYPDLDELKKYMHIHFTQKDHRIEGGKILSKHTHFQLSNCNELMKKHDPEISNRFELMK